MAWKLVTSSIFQGDEGLTSINIAVFGDSEKDVKEAIEWLWNGLVASNDPYVRTHPNVTAESSFEKGTTQWIGRFRAHIRIPEPNEASEIFNAPGGNEMSECSNFQGIANEMKGNRP